MGVLLLQLCPMSAAASSENRASFAAKYKFAQKMLAAAHGSPTGSQKATGVRAHTQKPAQHKECRRENTERQLITRVTSKNVNRPQTHVARSQDHPAITYNTVLGHFSTVSHRSNAEVPARRLIGTCIGLSSSGTLTSSGTCIQQPLSNCTVNLYSLHLHEYSRCLAAEEAAQSSRKDAVAGALRKINFLIIADGVKVLLYCKDE